MLTVLRMVVLLVLMADNLDFNFYVKRMLLLRIGQQGVEAQTTYF